jgi:hypothetical protein
MTTDTDALTGGYWCRSARGIAVWVSLPSHTPPQQTRHVAATVDPPVKAAPPRLPQKYPWVDATLLKAHAAYVRGRRDDWAREGERIYSRRRKRAQRKARRKVAA